jgi:hypothetical protein
MERHSYIRIQTSFENEKKKLKYKYNSRLRSVIIFLLA